MGTRAAGHSVGLEAAQSLGLLVGSWVCLTLSAAFVAQALHGVVRPPQPLPGERVNPNEAPAASLARLPGIGPTRARAIVAFRSHLQDQAEHKQVFRSAEDLLGVSGIGPATVEGVRPWMRFDPPLGEDSDPPAR